MTKVLGRGAFGTVVVGFKKTTGERVAVKMIDKSLMDLEDTEQLLAEIDILRAVSQKTSCVAKYLDCFETSRTLYIVQEIVEGVNILGFLSKGRKPEPEVKSIMRDLF
jgi:serine/threonine protein kinase